MEPTEKSLKGDMKYSDPADPQSPYEVAMFEAMFEADRLLRGDGGYNACIAEGLFNTEAKSRGVLLALNKLLAWHLIQHGINMLLPPESMETEIATITANIKDWIEKDYPGFYLKAVETVSEQSTKQ